MCTCHHCSITVEYGIIVKEYTYCNIECLSKRLSLSDLITIYKEQIKQVRGKKYTCECNTEYTRGHKARHEMSRKHLLWFIKQ